MLSLAELVPGAQAVIDHLDLDDPDALRLMELGFIPGAAVTCSGRSPFLDPVVYQVDGSEVALRRETAAKISVRRNGAGLG